MKCPLKRQSHACQIVIVIVLTARRDGLKGTPRIRFATHHNVLRAVRPERKGFDENRLGVWYRGAGVPLLAPSAAAFVLPTAAARTASIAVELALPT